MLDEIKRKNRENWEYDHNYSTPCMEMTVAFKNGVCYAIHHQSRKIMYIYDTYGNIVDQVPDPVINYGVCGKPGEVPDIRGNLLCYKCAVFYWKKGCVDLNADMEAILEVLEQ